MNLLPGVSLVKIGIYAAIILGLVGFGARMEHNRMQPKLDKVTAEFNQFKGGVTALGRAAQLKAELQARKDLKAKELADENAKAAADRNRTDIGRMRADADRTRGSGLPGAPAGSKCPPAQICFDVGIFESADRARRDALRQRRETVRGIADQGTQVEIDHNEAIHWANP